VTRFFLHPRHFDRDLTDDIVAAAKAHRCGDIETVHRIADQVYNNNAKLALRLGSTLGWFYGAPVRVRMPILVGWPATISMRLQFKDPIVDAVRACVSSAVWYQYHFFHDPDPPLYLSAEIPVDYVWLVLDRIAEVWPEAVWVADDRTGRLIRGRGGC
jgi:hypothetical protein